MLTEREVMNILHDLDLYEVVEKTFMQLPCSEIMGTAKCALCLREGKIRYSFIPQGEIDDRDDEIVLYELKGTKATVTEDVFVGRFDELEEIEKSEGKERVYHYVIDELYDKTMRFSDLVKKVEERFGIFGVDY